MRYYLAIDQGSHSSRALLFDASGQEIKRGERPLRLIRRNATHVEHDPRELLASVTGAVDDVLDGLAPTIRADIAACGIATQRSTVLAWDRSGEALGPVLSWQDVRGAAQVNALANEEAGIQYLTGLPLSPHYGASKLHWLMNEYAQANNSLRLSPLVSFLLYHLLEDAPYVVDHSNAQRTQLFDIGALDWSPRLLRLFDVPIASLPSCLPSCAHYGVLNQLPVAVNVVCGDQNAALFGAGELPPDTALVNLGSGAFILHPLAALEPAGRQLNGIAVSDTDTVQYVREATVNGAGSALERVAEQYCIDDVPTRLPHWLATVTDPPLFINTVGGLGSPWWRSEPAPAFVCDDNADDDSGDDDCGSDGERVVAVVESIVFMLRANLELMQKASPIKQLRVSGGLSASDGLCQKLANACRLPVERLDNPEATARGVAWLAAGRPAGWRDHASAKHFKPLLETGLEQRYARFMEIINQ